MEASAWCFISSSVSGAASAGASLSTGADGMASDGAFGVVVGAGFGFAVGAAFGFVVGAAFGFVVGEFGFAVGDSARESVACALCGSASPWPGLAATVNASMRCGPRRPLFFGATTALATTTAGLALTLGAATGTLGAADTLGAAGSTGRRAIQYAATPAPAPQRSKPTTSGARERVTERRIALSVCAFASGAAGFASGAAGFSFDSAAARNRLGVGATCAVGSSPPGKTPSAARGSGAADHPSIRRPHAAQNVAASGNAVWQCGH